MRRALIAYGTRSGATAGTAEAIAEVLRRSGLEVRVADLARDRVEDVAGYDLIIVGSGIRVERWTGAAEGFLKRHRGALAAKRLALFVSSGSLALLDGEKERSEARDRYLGGVASRCAVEPLSLGLFGGVWDFHRLPLWARALPAARGLMEDTRRKLVGAGVPEIRPGVYDTRDWEQIREWAEELIALATFAPPPHRLEA